MLPLQYHLQLVTLSTLFRRGLKTVGPVSHETSGRLGNNLLNGLLIDSSQIGVQELKLVDLNLNDFFPFLKICDSLQTEGDMTSRERCQTLLWEYQASEAMRRKDVSSYVQITVCETYCFVLTQSVKCTSDLFTAWETRSVERFAT